MTEFNPNTTGTKGLEWFPVTAGSVVLDSGLKAAAMSLRQATSQVIDAVHVGVGAIPTRGGLYVLEAYDIETAVPSNLASQIAYPNEDVSGVGTGTGEWRQNDASTTTIYTQIDEAVLDITDYIHNNLGGANIRYTGRMGTAALTLTGKRILAVALTVVANQTSGNAGLLYGLNISGVDYAEFALPPEQVVTALTKTWYYNPSTNLPWRIADVGLFDTTDEWFVETSGTPAGNVGVYQAYITVTYVDENRLAFGALNDTAGGLTANALNAVAMLTPTAGAWTKDGSGYHLFLARRLNDTGSLTIPTLTSSALAYPGNGYTPTLDATYGYATAMGDALPTLFQLLPHISGGTYSADGQPYVALAAFAVFTGQNAEQEFSNAAASAYGGLRFLAKPGASNVGAASLTVEVWGRASGLKIGTGTFTLTTAQWDALPVIPGSTYKLVQGALSSAVTLAAATQYVIKFAATAASAALGWVVAGVDIGSAALGGAASFGGTTDRATVNGAAESDRYEIEATVATVPTVPGTFAGALGSLAVDPAVCGTTGIGRADLTWVATSLAANFLYYEIQRTEDSGTTWETIALITTESIAAFYDYEARRGIAVGYRIRSARIDLSVSDWSATVTVTKTITCAPLFLVSNYDPTYNVAYDYQPQITADFMETADQVAVAIYGRDKHLGFQPIENRGAVEHYILTVAVDDQQVASGTGLQAFDLLRAIAHAPLPYVCVLDRWGNRLYAQLGIGSGAHVNPFNYHTAPTTATEVATAAYAVTVA